MAGQEVQSRSPEASKPMAGQKVQGIPNAQEVQKLVCVINPKVSDRGELLPEYFARKLFNGLVLFSGAVE
jgi:hypothetical protein